MSADRHNQDGAAGRGALKIDNRKAGMRGAAAGALMAVGLVIGLVGCAVPRAEMEQAPAAVASDEDLARAVASATGRPAPQAVAVQAQADAPVAAPAAAGPAEPGVVALRRINESQYRQGIADIFGDDIEIVGRFEPDQRQDGLMAIGASMLSISSGGFEQYLSMARSISEQVLDAKRRERILPCKAASATGPDDACTQQIVRLYGQKLFRRPLTDAEVAARVSLASTASSRIGSYDAGLSLALVSLLTAPEFLFRVETAELDPAAPGQVRLDGYTKAQRLSYLFWNTAPDDELLKVAASGEIHTQAGLKKQIDRLASSPKAERGVRAFFTDMLQFSRFENVIKDGKTFPKYSFAVAEAAQEQTLRTLVDLLLTRNGDYRDIFTTRETFINRSLAAVYDVPYLSGDEWTKYVYPEQAEQAGVITQVAFLSMFSHPGRTSPTKRGVAVHEVFLCHVMPLPADDVDFSLINDTNNGTLKTVRARLQAHASQPTCAACHTLTDPLGLALERFDGMGQWRTHENGVLIDATSQLNGKKFDGAAGMGEALRNNPSAPECLVRNVFTYGIGRMPREQHERDFLKAQNEAFARNGYQLRPLLVSIASSPEFYSVVRPQPPARTGTHEAPSAEGG